MNMKRVQQGFTLIELMIVVAIIGILAAVALPAYKDYTTKSKLSGATSIASTAMTAIGVACSEGNLNGATNATLGLPTDTAITSDYVKSVTASGSSATAGSVIIKLNAIGDIAADSTVTYTAACGDKGLTWTVTGSGVSSKFLPKT